MVNHISHFDPPLISGAIRRPVDYLASLEFFANPLLGAWFRGMNSIPFDRTRRDLGAIKVILDRLKRGRLVGIFPERGIRHGAHSILGGAHLNVGTGALAQKAGVPVIPALIIGSDQLYQWRSLYRRPRIFIRFGQPLLPAPGEDPRTVTAEIASRMHSLLEELRSNHGVTEKEMPHSAQERWANK